MMRRIRWPAAVLPLTLMLVVLLLLGAAACTCEQPKPRTAIPELLVAKLGASAAITIDGKLDEAAWSKAARTASFVDSHSGKPRPRSPVRGHARVGWDDSKLYVAFIVHDANPTSPFGADDVDPHVWARASGVELMIQPGDHGDNRHYFEVQVGINREVWDTRFDDYNRPITGPRGKRRFGHQSWKSNVERAVKIDRAARRYTLEMALPWSALASKRAATPPRSGDVWRINFYTFRDGQRHALAWSALLGQGNFHRARRFGRVRFGAAR